MFDMEYDMTVGLLKTWTGNAINVHSATMTTPTPYAKDLGNLLYHSAVVRGLSVGYSTVGKKILKMKPADLGRLDIEDSTKLVGTVALAFWTQDMLAKQEIIPANIINTA